MGKEMLTALESIIYGLAFDYLSECAWLYRIRPNSNEVPAEIGSQTRKSSSRMTLESTPTLNWSGRLELIIWIPTRNEVGALGLAKKAGQSKNCVGSRGWERYFIQLRVEVPIKFRDGTNGPPARQRQCSPDHHDPTNPMTQARSPAKFPISIQELPLINCCCDQPALQQDKLVLRSALDGLRVQICSQYFRKKDRNLQSGHEIVC
ncbi:hypothetical protein DdX_04455 [Ditylenchus destructor]|uniref:Uncharacterized protein n=1 Tax=Ditylenchus destructor TaxID=166010 RepID=A0AAD4R7S3_9BILA|nr:hypothetical protein DdX_04455 [Ditylenchus destructor]